MVDEAISIGMTDTAQRLDFDDHVIAALRAALPDLAKTAVTTIMDQVPSYRTTFTGHLGRSIRTAVELALENFLRLVTNPNSTDPTTPIDQSSVGAYELGRGEARSGRTIEALLAAYRVGARVCWRGFSAVASGAGVDAATMGQFAELVFAYIDALSAASISGHADELATTGRVRALYRERLAVKIANQNPESVLVEAAERAAWNPPEYLVAVLTKAANLPRLLPILGEDTLTMPAETVGLQGQLVVLFVPLASATGREPLVQQLADQLVIVGPLRPWCVGGLSFARTVLAQSSGLWDDHKMVDTELFLPQLVRAAAPDCVQDLAAQVLAPLADATAAQQQKLAATLHAWVMCQGHRDRMAEVLFVHPQTVRYRVQQLKEAYGDQLESPDFLVAASLALTELPQ